MNSVKIGDRTYDMSLDIIDVATVQAKTPKVTGRLSAGFKVDMNGDIVNDVDYVDPVEFGTSTRPGRFMITQSIDEIQTRHAEKLAREIEQGKILEDFKVEVKI